MKVIKEEELEQSVIDQFKSVSLEGAALVGCELTDKPIKIITAVNEYLSVPTKKKWFKNVDNWTEKALPIGT